ncbi:MAG TPA: sodium-translocating pyrophosphatase [bacterium]|nr:sodium-translocating pyrophosphatase [bacterium]HOH67290.1 sodium-translocating pyrophosphatase [bacterium]
MLLIWFCLLCSLVALGGAGVLAYRLNQEKVEEPRAEIISGYIRSGAKTFLIREYKILAVFTVLVTLVIFIMPSLSWKTGIAFLVGAIFSAAAGFVGMTIATSANVRTAEACRHQLIPGLRVAFASGSVMGLVVVGLGLLGISLLYLIFGSPEIIYGFGFGASLVALFARVGGGIYTKAADIGADLVGKMETGIPEDDLRNPATIADNVGDNVGDVAGLGADLFESYTESIIAAMVLGLAVLPLLGSKAIVLPLILSALGIIAALVGTGVVFLIKNQPPRRILNYGIWSATLVMVVFSWVAVKLTVKQIDIFWALLVGLLAGLIIGLTTEYYTSDARRPVREVSQSSKTGSATNIISGFSLGLISTTGPVLTVVAAIILAYKFGGIYGVAVAAVGLLSTLGITLATDSYGPVADNAAGLAEMAKLGPEIRLRAEELDAVGNTTAAIGKGFSIGSAALTALVLMISFGQAVNLQFINLLDVNTIAGLFIGGLLPFIFSALVIKAIGRAAGQMVEEVRRQFRETVGIMEGTVEPDYNRCIAISTSSALRQMILPGLLAVLAPVVVGRWLGAASLAGLLAGSIVSGFLLAVFMANAGGAWDNAKKYIEAGNHGGKGSAAHRASIVGDMVGDPLKDAAGPALNILIKLMAIVSIIIAPLLII